MYQKYVKRVLDLLCAIPAFIVLAPVLIVISVLVKMKLGGPVIFTQERPGYNEKIFKLYKFRTMTNEKDANGNLLPDETRLTRFGKFLRSTSLDELPELINIIRGDMSIIGPRPLLIAYLPYYSEEQHRRHEVKPGLVGLAALHGRNNQTWESKFKYDIQYVENISLFMDMKILFGAIRVVLAREGVSQEGRATTISFIEECMLQEQRK